MTSIGEGGHNRNSIPVVLVTAPGCHLCAHARSVLAELGHDYPMDTSEVDGDSLAGTGLLSRFRPPFLPLLLVDGRPFGHGRISQRKLERHLARLRTPVRTAEV